MAEISSGHGGDFELVQDDQGNFKPNLEFTLPIEFLVPDPKNEIRFDNGGLQPPNVNFPTDIPNTHPNKLPNERHLGLIEKASRYGKFETFNKEGRKSLPYERMDYAIQYTDYEDAAEISIPDDDAEKVVRFHFTRPKETYAVLVAYNFRLADHPVVPDRYLTFSSDDGPVSLSALCYVYIVLANVQLPDPQFNGISSVTGTELYINATKLIRLMTRSNGPPPAALSAVENAKLYYAEASEINDYSLSIDDWNIKLTQVAERDTVGPSQETTFTITPNNFSSLSLQAGHIPLGLYIFGELETPSNSGAEGSKEGGEVEIFPSLDSKVDINEADESKLDTITGVGPELAKRIILERKEARFGHIRDIMRVNGIGPTLFKRLKGEITV